MTMYGRTQVQMPIKVTVSYVLGFRGFTSFHNKNTMFLILCKTLHYWHVHSQIIFPFCLLYLSLFLFLCVCSQSNAGQPLFISSVKFPKDTFCPEIQEKKKSKKKNSKQVNNHCAGAQRKWERNWTCKIKHLKMVHDWRRSCLIIQKLCFVKINTGKLLSLFGRRQVRLLLDRNLYLVLIVHLIKAALTIFLFHFYVLNFKKVQRVYS